MTVGAEPTVNVAAYRQGATVSIETTDGRTFTNSVFVPRGAGCAGIDWLDVEEKCLALMPKAPLGNAKIDTILTKIRNMPDLDSAADLAACLV